MEGRAMPGSWCLRRCPNERSLFGAGALGGAAIDAFVIEPNWLDVAVHDVPVEGLPGVLDGFTLARVPDGT